MSYNGCMRQRSILVLAALATAFALGAGIAQAAGGAGAPDADRNGDGIFDNLAAQLADQPADARVSVIVTLDGPASASAVAALQSRVGPFTVGRSFTLIDGFAARVSKEQVSALAAAPGVQHVEENGTVSATNGPGNSAFGVTQARADLPGSDGSGLAAAVIDTGIDPGHLDLAGKVVAFVDCLSPVAAPVCTPTAAYDDHGHGTHVAGTIAGTGVASGGAERGVAPGASLVGVKVLDATGSGSEESVIAGIQWVVAHRATYTIRAINMSLSGGGCSDGTDALSQASDEAAAAGVVVVVAAGNAGPWPCSISSPSAAAAAVTVGAMGDFSQLGFRLATFSSRGPTLDGRIKPDVVAPGIAVVSTRAGTTNGYSTLSGTSMATPFVAGLALLLQQQNPTLTTAQVKSILTSTAVDFGTPGADVDYGFGRVDAYAALRAAGAAINTPPTMPSRTFQQGSLGAGGSVTLQIAVTGSSFPLAATVLMDEWAAGATMSLTLRRPDGSVASTSTLGTRHERVLAAAPVAGIWTVTIAATGAIVWQLDVSAQLGVGGVTAGSPPTVTGSAVEGALLTGSAGTWTGEAPQFTTLRWLRCDAAGATCTPLPGAVSPTYSQVAADIGATLRLEATVSNWLGYQRLTSAPSAVVAAAAPVLATPYSIVGAVVAGAAVGAAGGSWTSSVPVTVTYAWQLCDAATTTACSPAGTGSTLTLPQTAAGYRARLTATATSSGGSAATTVTSAIVAPAAPAGSGLVGAGLAAGAAGGGYATVAPLPGEAGRERIEFALRVATGGVVYGKQLTLRFREGGQAFVLRTTSIDTGGLFVAGSGTPPRRAFFAGAATLAAISPAGVETPLPGVYRVTVDVRDLAEPGAGADSFAAWVGAPDGTTVHQGGTSAAPLVLASGNMGFRRS